MILLKRTPLGWEKYRDELLREYPVERIIALASNGKAESRRLYSRFGRWARNEDLNILLQHLRCETDPEACLRLLWVFGKAKLPHLDARIWELAHDDDPRLQAAAVKALSSLCDPRVGELGRQRLRDNNFSAGKSDDIELFVNNYQAGDEELILAALERLAPNDDEAHDLGMSARRVCSHNNSPALTCVASWIYRTNPCTICRNDGVELMLQWESLPAAIAEECVCDASNDTRSLMNERK